MEMLMPLVVDRLLAEKKPTRAAGPARAHPVRRRAGQRAGGPQGAAGAGPQSADPRDCGTAAGKSQSRTGRRADGHSLASGRSADRIRCRAFGHVVGRCRRTGPNSPGVRGSGSAGPAAAPGARRASGGVRSEIAAGSPWRVGRSRGANPAEVRSGTLGSLGRLSAGWVSKMVLGHYGELEPELQPRAIEPFDQRREWAHDLLDAVAAKQVPVTAL